MPAQRRALAYAVVALAVVAVAPWRLVDPDVLSNLAVGRAIAEAGSVPTRDPFTFSAPERPWSNPEWLSHLGAYGAFVVGGERGLVAAKLAALAFAWLLAVRLGEARGAPTLLVAAVLLIALAGSVERLTARNHVHAFWLVSASALLAHRAARDGPRWALALLPLTALWANLHSSFVLAPLIAGAAAVDGRLAPSRHGRGVRALVAVTLALPVVALLNPFGAQVYAQLADHVRGAATYRALVLEWQPAPHTFAPLILFGGLVAASAIRTPRRWGAIGLATIAIAMAFASRRFVPVATLIAAPLVAAAAHDVLTRRDPRERLGRRVAVAATALGLVIVASIAVVTHTTGRPPLLDRDDDLITAIDRLAAADPPARVFNSFNDGPWILWRAGPRVRTYIDPRNTLGAAALRRYRFDILTRPAQFEAETARLSITHALVDRAWAPMNRVAKHLASSGAWRALHRGPRYVLYARR